MSITVNDAAGEMEPEDELVPVETDGIDVSENLAGTSHRFICIACHVVNNPPEPRNTCGACGAIQPAPEPAPSPIEHLERQATGLAPTDVPLPLDAADAEPEGFERFNANKAMSAIIDKNTEVQADRDDWNRLKKATADAKKTLDEGEAALARIISTFARAREAQNSPQALLPLNGQAPAVESNCPWERAHPGQVCIICREAQQASLSPAGDSPVHPEHQDHETTAANAHHVAVIAPLIPQLETRGLYIHGEDLEELPTDDLQSLIAWTEQDGVIPPPLLLASHVAGTPGSLAQLCLHCETVLADAGDAEGFYPAGAFVGLDCEKKISHRVEPARPPKSHAKKRATTKREPEKEHAKQVAAGLGFERAGFTTRWQVEINPSGKRVAGKAAPYTTTKKAAKKAKKR